MKLIINNGLSGRGLYYKYNLLIKKYGFILANNKRFWINKGGIGGGMYGIFSYIFSLKQPGNGNNSLLFKNGKAGYNGYIKIFKYECLFLKYYKILFLNKIMFLRISYGGKISFYSIKNTFGERKQIIIFNLFIIKKLYLNIYLIICLLIYYVLYKLIILLY